MPGSSLVGVGELVAVCVTAAIRDDPNTVGRTGIDKRPVAGPVRVGAAGLAGDTICDEERHGGRNQAVYAYAREEAVRWAGELGHDVAPGWFGENLTVRGLAVTDSVVGERWRIGGERADAVILEVTLPRIPCATFGRWVHQARWVRRFTERGDVGAYLRVVAGGSVAAGDPVEVVSRPRHGVSVRALFAGADVGLLSRLLDEGEDVAGKAVTRVEKLVEKSRVRA